MLTLVSKDATKRVGKELKSLVGAEKAVSMGFEQTLDEVGVAERVISRRRKSVAERIEKAKMVREKRKGKAGKKEITEIEKVVVISDGEDAVGRRLKNRRWSSLERDSTSEEDNTAKDPLALVKSLEMEEKRIMSEVGAGSGSRGKRTILNTEELLDLGEKIGWNKNSANNSSIRKIISEVFEKAQQEGVVSEEMEEDCRDWENESNEMFDWAKELEEESDDSWGIGGQEDVDIAED